MGKCVNVNEFEKYAATVEDIIATSTGNDFVTFEIKNIVPIVVAKKIRWYRSLFSSKNQEYEDTIQYRLWCGRCYYTKSRKAQNSNPVGRF